MGRLSQPFGCLQSVVHKSNSRLQKTSQWLPERKISTRNSSSQIQHPKLISRCCYKVYCKVIGFNLFLEWQRFFAMFSKELKEYPNRVSRLTSYQAHIIPLIATFANRKLFLITLFGNVVSQHIIRKKAFYNIYFVLSPSIVSLISSELMCPFSMSWPPRSLTTPTRFSLAFNSCKAQRTKWA